MHLGSYNAQTRHFDCIRDLSPEEATQYETSIQIFSEARDRLSLFRMLHRNFSEWRSYLDRLLSHGFKEEVDVSEELNRLLLNYLTMAYSIQEHFSVSFRRRFRRRPVMLQKYEAFVSKLCQTCWPFAFVLDFRNYVQHVGFGITRNGRTVDDRSIRIEVVANAVELLEGSRDWRRSKLKAESGDLDLVETIKEFHIQMIQSYAVFVAKTFFPELQSVSDYYGRLVKEVHDRDASAKMIFFQEKPQGTPGEGGKVSVNMGVIFVPNDVFRELGIRINSA